MKPSFIFPFLLVCAEIMVFLANDMYLPALTTIMHDLDVNASAIQTTLTTWFLGSTSMQLIVGPLSDRWGRKPILISGIILFIGSTLFCTLTSDIFILSIARFIQGSTVCFIIVAGYASIHELFDQKNAIQMLATMNSISILAPALGPLLGGIILWGTNWRWIFGCLFLLGVVILFSLLKWMPEPLPAAKRHPLKLNLLFTQYKSILLNQRFMLFLLPYCLIFCGFISWLVSGPFLVVNRFHESPVIFGLYQLFIFCFYIVGNRIVKRRMDIIGVHKLIQGGLSVALIGGLFSLLTAWLLPNFLTGLIMATALFALGFGLASAPLQRLAIDSAEEPMGSRMAVLSTFMGLFGSLATALVSLLYNNQLTSLAFILLGTAAVAYMLYTRLHHPSTLLAGIQRLLKHWIPAKNMPE